MHKLPKILEREPLVDAIFEVRLSGTSPLADVLPGFLLHEYDPKPKISRLPAAELPFPVRSNDPNLRFSPVLRLDLERFQILVGDQSFAISCKLPYPKWPNFKSAIIDLATRVARAGIEGRVDRYSIKYVNLIEASNYAEQLKKIRVSVHLGEIEVSTDHISLQVHHKEDDVIHIMSVVTGAHAKKPDGREIVGVVVDIDSIRSVDHSDFVSFSSSLELGLEDLRQANKAKFFSCLERATIKELGPVYE